MILSLNLLFILQFANITNGKLEVNCDTIRVIKATYNGKKLAIYDKKITIKLSSDLRDMAPEDLCQQNIDLVIEIDPKQSIDKNIKVLVNLPSTHATVSDPMLKDGQLTATICVASIHARSLPERAMDVIVRNKCTIATITVPVTDITNKDEFLNLQSSGLKFTFHRDIAKKAMNLLKEAMGHNEEEKPVEFSANISPSPLFNDNGNKSTGNWADDADEIDPYSPSPSPSPVPTLPREVEANPFDGVFFNVSSKDEQKAKRKAQREAEQAKREAEQFQHLEQERLEQERLEALRLKDLADIARVEQKRQEAEAKAKEEWVKHDALVKEFEALDQIVKNAVNVNLEQWVQNPETWRATIANVMSGTTHAIEPVEVQNLCPEIWVKTTVENVVKNLQALAQQHCLQIKVTIQQYDNCRMYFIDVAALVTKCIFDLRVSAWGNEIVFGQKMPDGTLKHGTCANVHHRSYDALMSVFPNMKNIVQKVIQTREECKHHKPLHIQQQCVIYVPVYFVGPFPPPSQYA
jgi:hypothetical protein